MLELAAGCGRVPRSRIAPITSSSVGDGPAVRGPPSQPRWNGNPSAPRFAARDANRREQRSGRSGEIIAVRVVRRPVGLAGGSVRASGRDRIRVPRRLGELLAGVAILPLSAVVTLTMTASSSPAAVQVQGPPFSAADSVLRPPLPSVSDPLSVAPILAQRPGPSRLSRVFALISMTKTLCLSRRKRPRRKVNRKEARSNEP